MRYDMRISCQEKWVQGAVKFRKAFMVRLWLKKIDQWYSADEEVTKSHVRGEEGSAAATATKN